MTAAIPASLPVSTPVIPAQPPESLYSVDYLNLFQLYNRASYAAKFGQHAPVFNPSRRQKGWFDTSLSGSDSDVVSYRVVNSSGGQVRLDTVVMSVGEARAINLAGAEAFPPPADPAPSGVFIVDAIFNSRNPVDSAMLSTAAEAQLIGEMLGQANPPVLAPLGGPSVYYDYISGETRRVWEIVLTRGNSTVHLNVGHLLKQMNQFGAGAPGHWFWSSPDAQLPIWLHDIDPGQLANNDPRPPWPVPVRDLLPNESWYPTPFGIKIQRSDLQSSTPAPNSAQLQRIEDMLTKITSAMFPGFATR